MSFVSFKNKNHLWRWCGERLLVFILKGTLHDCHGLYLCTYSKSFHTYHIYQKRSPYSLVHASIFVGKKLAAIKAQLIFSANFVRNLHKTNANSNWKSLLHSNWKKVHFQAIRKRKLLCAMCIKPHFYCISL